MFQNLNPLDKSTATLEILIMLLVAFILGFMIAWLFKRKHSREAESSHENCEGRVEALKLQLATTHKAKEKLEIEINDLKLKMKAASDSDNKKKTETETSSSKISEADTASASLLGFTAVTSDNKDDLTQISGVGPFIEEKLNGLGIYTFEQISGFSDETIDKVTEAIAFFPGRIQRDNWVNQSKELMTKD